MMTDLDQIETINNNTGSLKINYNFLNDNLLNNVLKLIKSQACKQQPLLGPPKVAFVILSLYKLF